LRSCHVNVDAFFFSILPNFLTKLEGMRGEGDEEAKKSKKDEEIKG
jgi:hypothetical protein